MAKQLKSHQRKIFEALADLDPKLGNSYIGALDTLACESHDKVAQTANSIRNIMGIISRISGLPYDSNNSEDSAVLKVAKVLDPSGIMLDNPLAIKKWNLMNQKFTDIAHHGTEPTEDEFRRTVDEWEYFVADFVFQEQDLTLNDIDELLTKGPSGVDWDILNLKINKNFDSNKYFFEKVGSNWLDDLVRHDYFQSIPLPILNENRVSLPPWPQMHYLARIAEERPGDVIEVLLEIKLPEDLGSYNPHVLAVLIEACINMPVSQSNKIIKRIAREKWLHCRYGSILSHKMIDLLKKYLKEKDSKAALCLSYELSEIKSAEEIKTKESLFAQADGYLQDWEYSEFLKAIEEINPKDAGPFIKLLIKRLSEAVLSELSAKNRTEHSSVWRPTIENSKHNWNHNEIKERLLGTILKLIDKSHLHFKDRQNALNFMKNFMPNPNNLNIIARIYLHTYRKHPKIFAKEISESIANYFDKPDLWHEWSMLLKENYLNLSQAAKNLILKNIQKGPKQKMKKEFIEYWKARRLIFIKNYLDSSQKKILFKELKLAKKIDNPDTLSTHTSWTGPTSPITKNDLGAKSIEEIFEYLVMWKPNKDILGDSRDGLGRVFQEVVMENPLSFSQKTKYLKNPSLHITYIYYFLLALAMQVREGKKIAWKPVILLCKMIVNNELKIDYETARKTDIGKDAVYKQIADLLGAGLFAKNCPSHNLREDILSIITLLCEYKDPTMEDEDRFGGGNMEPHMLAINSVRGEAFEALFAYIEWNWKYSKKNEFPEQIKVILERHLQKRIEPGLAIRSVYGNFLVLIHFRDKKWFAKNIDKILPKSNYDQWLAVWEVYLARLIYKEVFGVLYEQYKFAIDNSEKVENQKRKFIRDPNEMLAEHLAIGFLFKFEKATDPLFDRFLKKVQPSLKCHAIGFIGRKYIFHLEGGADATTNRIRMIRFWSKRLKETSDAAELRGFGWWIKPGFFNNDSMLKNLCTTLDKTKGLIENEHGVLEGLETLSHDHPFLVAKALFLMIKNSNEESYYLLSHNTTLKSALLNILQSNNTLAIKYAEKVRNIMLLRGDNGFRDLGNNMTPEIS